MIVKDYPLKNQGCFLKTYIIEPSIEMKHIAIKPVILILPGGGYQFISDREAEVVALEYLKEGYQAFILHYSLTNQDKKSSPVDDGLEAIELIKSNHQAWFLDSTKIACLGFSAGAHLALELGSIKNTSIKALVLGYPAINSIPSINYEVTIPKINKENPEAFIFHTFFDGLVDVSNALYIANQYKTFNIPFELHIYRDGDHGMSLGNELVSNEWLSPDEHYQSWLPLSITWLKRVLKPFVKKE